jgi:stage V sporulation protein G
MNMQITEVRIPPANEDFVKAYASMCLDNCFLVPDIRVIKGPTGLFISFPNRTKSEGGQHDIAFSVHAETRNMIEQAILAEYEKVVGGIDPVSSDTK